jgi:hypothetical protein
MWEISSLSSNQYMRHFLWITHLHLVPRLRAYKDWLLCLLFTFITCYSFTQITFPHFLQIPLNKYKYLSLFWKSRLSCFLSPWTQVSNMLWSVGGQSGVHSTLYGNMWNVGVDSKNCRQYIVRRYVKCWNGQLKLQRVHCMEICEMLEWTVTSANSLQLNLL